jgi:hypothetical protein
MPRREDIVSCIDVTIMYRFAYRALPSPDSKIFPAFGAGAAVTHAAGLGGKRFINFSKPHACVIALILQHGSKRTPARIEHRLGQLGLGERGGIDVADEESTVGLDELSAQFVKEIFAPIRNLGVNRSASVSMPGALCPGEEGFQVAVEALSAPPRIFFGNLLHRLNRQMQAALPARSYLARQTAKPWGVLVLHPQAQDPDRAGSRTGHPYSLPKNDPITPRQTSRNAGRGRHAALRASLSLAGLKAGVSRGEMG